MLVVTITVIVAVTVPITALAIARGSARNIPQRAVVIGEVGGVQHLQARIVLAIEWRLCGRATRILRRLEGIKPQSEMVHLNGIEGGIQGGIRDDSVVENGRCRRATLRE